MSHIKQLKNNENNLRFDCKLGLELKEQRLKHGLTLYTMAEELGWSCAKLSQIEHGRLPLSQNDAQQLDDYCKLKGLDLSGSAVGLWRKYVEIDLTDTKRKLSEIMKRMSDV